MSDYDILTRKKMLQDMKDSLETYINKWVDANCTNNPEWAEHYFAPETPERMTEAAWQVFLSSRDGQRFLENNG